MTGRKKFVLSVIGVFTVFILFIISQIYYGIAHKSIRSIPSLLNQYYSLKRTSPEGAKRALELILVSDPKNELALRELGYWYLRQGNLHDALKLFNRVHQLYPNNAIAIGELKRLNTILGIKTVYPQSHVPIQMAISTKKFTLPNLALPVDLAHQTYHDSNQHQYLTPSTSVATMLTTNERDRLMNIFYEYKVKDKQRAWSALHELLLKYPDDLDALKEAGYFTLAEDDKEASAGYFERAYAISHDPKLALQLGYIFDGIKNKKMLSYHYFDLATKTTDLNERMKAELAKTNLRGFQLRILPDPYYANGLFYPFYQSRFKLLIYPMILRAGVMLNKEYNLSTYISYRRTKDNKSSSANQLPQIYEDDAAISALGLQGTPFPKFPLVIFGEAGRAQDLIYRQRSRWRNDFRGGLAYYDEWGRKARYTLMPRVMFQPNADLYADTVYFTRYQNVIATLRARPGVEVFRYGSMYLNLYLKAFLSQDTKREFYNNILEIGPSVALTPSDRYNVTLRFECLQGYYLPASSPSPNPYGPRYHNNMIFIDTYLGI